MRKPKRLDEIHRRQVAAAAASYRMEVRRRSDSARIQLSQIAGRVYLKTAGTAEERAAYDALLACEALSLPIGEPDRTELVPAKAYPPFDQDVAAATAALPGWLGVRFRALPSDEIKHLGLKPGAAEVLDVMPDSPAKRAGMAIGDTIIGPPGSPFTQPNELRSWVMLSKAGEPRTVEVLRAWRRLELASIPDPYPAAFPELPGPPKVGDLAPPLHVTGYRGKTTSLADGKKHLLVFWATWCLPCKLALPELRAFAAKTGAQVIGITDQRAQELDKFFSEGGAYLEDIALDDHRQTFLAYGVSGTPMFVLVDGDGKDSSVWTGYSAAKGLEIEGWKGRQGRRISSFQIPVPDSKG
jgi:thiol-disulfide isomerase/thioredoxin